MVKTPSMSDDLRHIGISGLPNRFSGPLFLALKKTHNPSERVYNLRNAARLEKLSSGSRSHWECSMFLEDGHECETRTILLISFILLHLYKALDSFGNCQRPVFSLGCILST